MLDTNTIITFQSALDKTETVQTETSNPYTLIPGATAPLTHQFLVLGCGSLIIPLVIMLIHSLFTHKDER